MLPDIINKPITAPVAVVAFFNKVLRKVSEPVRIELEDVISYPFPEGPAGIIHSVTTPDGETRKVFTSWENPEVFDTKGSIFVKNVRGKQFDDVEFFSNGEKDQEIVPPEIKTALRDFQFKVWASYKQEAKCG